jgi:hypothetical protein
VALLTYEILLSRKKILTEWNRLRNSLKLENILEAKICLQSLLMENKICLRKMSWLRRNILVFVNLNKICLQEKLLTKFAYWICLQQNNLAGSDGSTLWRIKFLRLTNRSTGVHTQLPQTGYLECAWVGPSRETQFKKWELQLGLRVLILRISPEFMKWVTGRLWKIYCCLPVVYYRMVFNLTEITTGSVTERQ